MNQTNKYKLSQWSPEDRIRREDFNSDNLKLETALSGLDTSLSRLTSSVNGKMSKIEILETYDGISMFSPPPRNWNDWDLIGMVISHPNTPALNTTMEFGLQCRNYPNDFKIEGIPTPGYLMIMMPHHNAARPVEGFLVADRFIPFTCAFNFQDITLFDISVDVPKSSSHTVFFGTR